MAKRRSSKNNPPVSSSALPSLPGVSDDPPEVVTPPAAKPIADIPQAVAEIAKPKPPPELEAVKVTYKTIKAPWISGLVGYARRRHDCNLSASQAVQLKGIQAGLEQENATLANGRYVSSPTHAIQWLIEQTK